jgi:proteic killer suppression protein
MIRSYRDRRTFRFVAGERVKEFESFARGARKRLLLIDAATSLRAIAAVPGHRLEALKGDRKGQYSVRINDQWRICFVWNDEERCAEQVEIVDYH